MASGAREARSEASRLRFHAVSSGTQVIALLLMAPTFMTPSPEWINVSAGACCSGEVEELHGLHHAG